MRIKILSGPAAGQIRHAEKSQNTQLLIDAGLAELVIEPPAAPPKVTWTVRKGQLTERIYLAGTCSRPNCGTTRYEGPAAQAATVKFQHSCGADALPDAISADVIAQYARAKGEEVPVVTKDEAVYWGIFHNKSTDNTHRLVDHGKAIPGQKKLAYES